MFYLFGVVGLLWVLLWLFVYREVRGATEEEFIQPPKVSVCYVLIVFAGDINVALIII